MPRTSQNQWSNSQGMYGKDRLPALVSSSRGSARGGSDADKMEWHLKGSSLSKAMYLQDKMDNKAFNPLDVPLIDILMVETEKQFRWSDPSH